jgi:hypothetical protein
MIMGIGTPSSKSKIERIVISPQLVTLDHKWSRCLPPIVAA